MQVFYQVSMRLLIQFIVVLCMGTSVWAGSEKTLAVAFGKARPPYAFSEKGQIRGIEVELAREALSRMGYQVKPQSISSYRIEAEAKHGNNFDVVVGVPLASDGARYYSKPFVSYENVVLAFKSKKISVKAVKDLKNLRVGVWANARHDLGKDFARHFPPLSSGKPPANYIEFAKQDEQFKALWSDKIDVLIMDRSIFGWFRGTMATQVDVLREVEVFPIFEEPNLSCVAFLDQKMRNAFDHEIEKMRESGEYERIVRGYVGEKIAAMFKTNGKTH